jgi:hypothetical protein
MIESRSFWSTLLPWRIFALIAYGTVSVYMLARFWRPPIDWVWWLLLATCAFTWILSATNIAREIRSLGRGRLPGMSDEQNKQPLKLTGPITPEGWVLAGIIALALLCGIAAFVLNFR